MRFAANIFPLLLVACSVWLCGPALAQSACTEPAPPPPVDGAVTTADQLRAANAEARAFISESGVYQACLSSEVEAAKTRATAEGMPLDPAIEADAKARIAASQRAQEKIGLAINSAMTSYKLAHANN
ncbi:MAG TPA: hypothetical protein VFQ52_09505 [Rhizomicrobium sp.]|nr:hypothetical protein [Rhizomicrobium sp.]